MSNKTQAEELADEYARCAAKTNLENLYGTSKSYTEQCLQHENAARGKLMVELRRLAGVEAERDRLAAEVEALRADAERWRMLPAELLDRVSRGLRHERTDLVGFVKMGNELGRAKQLDAWIAAMDAARKEQG